MPFTWGDLQAMTCREPDCEYLAFDNWCRRHILLREGWTALDSGKWRRPKDDGKTYTLRGAWRKRREAAW